MPRADRTNTTPDMRPRCIGKLGLLATVALALSGPAAFAWDYSAPTPPPSDPPTTTITNSPMGGAGGVGGQGGTGGAGGHATAIATARGGKASVAITVDPVVAAPTTPATPASGASDPTTARHTAGTGDPSGGHHHGGNGNGGGHGGNDNLPVASAVAPWVGDNANPCTGASASIAVQTQLFGIGAGGNRMDYGCAGERMNNLETVGQQLDFAYQCLDDRRFAQAAYSIGHPCPADRQRYAHETAAMQPVVTTVSSPVAPTRPDYCAPGRGWSAAQLSARYTECR
jgi:hypothetical protein